MLTNFFVTVFIFSIAIIIITKVRKEKKSTILSIGISTAVLILMTIIEEWVLLMNYTADSILLVSCISILIVMVILYFFTKEIIEFRMIHLAIPTVILCLIGGVQIVDHFHTQNKYDSLKIVEADSSSLNFNEKEVYKVDQDFALNKISKSLSQVPNHSFYEVKSINLTLLNGELTYVAEIGHKGFFSWFKKKEIPGYFTLSATDMQAETKFIKVAYLYSDASFFGYDADRAFHPKTRNNLIGTKHLELDDEGNPYYIQPIQEKVNVTSGETPTGISLLNLQTGKVMIYPLDQAPKWIDDAISSKHASYIADVRGEYPHGTFNRSNDGKMTPIKNGEEEGMKPVFIQGKKYYFIEFSTYGSKGDSMADALLIDARSGISNKIIFSGGMVDSKGAITIGEERYIDLKLKGVNPMLYKIGQSASETWVYSLLDRKNNHVRFVFVNARNLTISADDSNMVRALAKYEHNLSKASRSLQIKDTEKLPDVKKDITIEHIAHVSLEGTFTFYVKSVEGEKFIYPTNIVEEMIFYGPNDKIHITYKETGDINTILSFEEKE